jgi:DUF971 family protein
MAGARPNPTSRHNRSDKAQQPSPANTPSHRIDAAQAPTSTQETTMPTCTELNLHRQSRVLEISFDDGSHYNLPCEFLRVYSPSAEVQGHGPGQGTLQVGKEDVNIDQIEPVGHYAICLHFDDEHNTGIYSWDYLHNLGEHQEALWQQYLADLEQAGHKRKKLS